MGDSNILAKAEEKRYGSGGFNAGSGHQTNARNSLDNEDFNLSANSLEDINFSDDSYERILSEVVDDLANDDRVVSNSRGCDNLETSANESRISTAVMSSTIPNVMPSIGMTAADEPDTAITPLPLAAKKLQQTNLRCYFGLNHVKKSSATCSGQEQSIHLTQQFNTNHGTKDGKRGTNYAGDNNRGQNVKKVRTCPFYKKIPGERFISLSLLDFHILVCYCNDLTTSMSMFEQRLKSTLHYAKWISMAQNHIYLPQLSARVRCRISPKPLMYLSKKGTIFAVRIVYEMNML